MEGDWKGKIRKMPFNVDVSFRCRGQRHKMALRAKTAEELAEKAAIEAAAFFGFVDDACKRDGFLHNLRPSEVVDCTEKVSTVGQDS